SRMVRSIEGGMSGQTCFNAETSLASIARRYRSRTSWTSARSSTRGRSSTAVAAGGDGGVFAPPAGGGGGGGGGAGRGGGGGGEWERGRYGGGSGGGRLRDFRGRLALDCHRGQCL